ncbi:EpsG family protein [Lactiplantibacillus paraplantarum]|uniref:EpsG family protein n=1 Tax=Lactiplantibacillus paraplantarum TaxID=60520 RepID=A0AAD0TYG4_9LACO|nr:EpsG family protein [Lactiplantibacillus paraplantarum]AYJ40225.1 hypothetical protein LP667_15620 [Lactiplantibacillus paraplantarum]KRL45379.1 hypothetical protein FD48_GL002689 [Lactiplantibacillus paraplantarum DSM 10667]GEO62612.1 hypothetical protein LPA07_29330 [Lactiplantibacillus paraplantarum]
MLSLIVTVIALFFYPFGAAIIGFSGIIFSNKYRLIYSMAFAVLLGLYGYYFLPSHEIDLTRYFAIIQQYQVAPPRISDVLQSQGIFLGAFLLFKLVAILNNLQLLPAIVGFVTGTCLLYIAADSFSRNSTSKSIRIYLILIIMFIFPFAAAYSNVRNILACSLIMVAIYRDLVQKKMNFGTIVLYLLGLSFHIAVAVIIMLRIALNICRNKSFFNFLLLIVVGIAIFFIPYSRNVIIEIISKGTQYATVNDGNVEYVAYINQSLFMQITKAMNAVVSVITTLVIYRNYIAKKTEWNLFSFLLGIITCVSFSIRMPVYMRLLFGFLMISVPQYSDFLSRKNISSDIVSIVLFCVFIGCFFMFIANIVTFNEYASFSFASIHALIFELTDWFGGMV